MEHLEWRRLLAGTPTFTVAFDDPGGAYSSWYATVRSTILAAAADWAKYIDSGAKVDLSVDFDSSLTSPTLATAGFDRRVFFRQAEGYEIQIGNVAAELRTGVDQNGSLADADISIRPGALDEFYFDASAGRTGTVPADKIDARSVLLHELGHVLGFFGDGGGDHDSPAGNRLAYDQYVDLEGGELFFTGPNAEAAYGQAVPLSHDDSSHVGNDDGPGEDVANDLMAPAIPDGVRRFISDVDLGILADSGVPMKTTQIPVVLASDVTVVRAAGRTADFVLTLSKTSKQTVTVPVRTINGTGVAGRDYVALSRNVTFAPGETTKTVSVKLLAGNPFDKTKTVTLNLGLPTHAALLRGQATATIRNTTPAADAKHTASITEANGNVVTVNVRGPGVATVARDAFGNLDTITMTGSSAATTLVIRSKKAGVLHGITAGSALGVIDAPNTSFGGVLQLKGTSRVTLLDVLAGSTMKFAGTKQVAFVARDIKDATITTPGAFASFVARSWTDTDNAGDLLKAAGLTSVTVRREMQADVVSTGTIGTLSVGTLRAASVRARGSVKSVSVGSAIGSDVFVGTNAFAQTKGEFTNAKAVLGAFVVRAAGTFSDTRIAAPVLATATLGTIDVDNADVLFGIAADSVGAVAGSTPLEPTFKRAKLTAAKTIGEDDFVVRVL